ncbi:MAG: glycosyltransferase family 4 protein [Flavobacterium sp.]|nr:MAG: glycosyltransferase family 4 protein [Flavobacterium sp.]
MTVYYLICILIALFAIELFYFKIADHFNIIDKPNHRSSHTAVTIRGGGIIFAIAAVLFFVTYSFEYPFFILGLALISFISFLDDVMTLDNKIRLSIHLIAVLLLFYQWNLYGFEWYWLIIAGIFVIGTINAYNFMDGINGITGSYSLLAVITLLYINDQVISFTSAPLLIVVGLSLVVFNIFNFRKKAKCFAGDVGSVSIAFILVFVIGQLILKTENFAYILLLLCYGLDTAFTVLFRKIRKENIFKAHRSHFYQFLANEKKISHISVSILYFTTQLIINIFLVICIQDSAGWSLFTLIMSGLLFFVLRLFLEGKERLFTQIHN